MTTSSTTNRQGIPFETINFVSKKEKKKTPSMPSYKPEDELPETTDKSLEKGIPHSEAAGKMMSI